MKSQEHFTLIESDHLDRHISFVIKKLGIACEKLEKGTLSFHYGGRPIRAKKIDVIRVISQINFDNELHFCIKNIILEAILTSESLAVGSGFFLLKNLTRNKIPKKVNSKNRSTIDDLNKSLSDLMGVGLSKDIVFSIIKEASIDSDVILNTSPIISDTIIRSRPALTVRGEIHPLFECKRKNLENVGIVAIDGVIEEISEINTLLQGLSNNKKSLALITRGYSPDVVSTLSHNYKMSNLYVYPFQVFGDENVFSGIKEISSFFDLENIKTLNETSSDSLEYDKEVHMRNNSLEIVGGGSIRKKVYVTFPSHYKNVLGVLSDRVLIGLKHAKEISKSGNSTMKCNSNIISNLAFHQANMGLASLRKSLKNLGCTVLQET